LILPKPSEEKRLMRGGGVGLYSKYRKDENFRRALFYAALALEEAFGVYRSALREVAEGLREAVQRVEAGELPFKKVVYIANVFLPTQLTEKEETAFDNALRILRERLNEYAVKHGLRDLLDVEEGKARGSLPLKGLEKKVEVNGKEHVVKVIDGSAEFKRGRDGKILLRIRITAEVDGVLRNYEITYSRRGAGNAAKGYATAKADASGGRVADAERFSALVEALTGRRPRVYRRSNGTIEIECGREHLNGFRRYKEFADTIEKWLEQTEG
jgi:hypothetical protein